MKYNSKLRTAAVVAYGVVTVLFLLFFLYMGLFENVSVYRARGGHSYAVVEDHSMEMIADQTAPAGVRKAYRWTLDEVETGGNCLSFYLVHHYAQVYFDGELMYSLTPGEGNRIGRSISSNWVTVPIEPEDGGKGVTVLVTPVYPSMVDREIEFMVGSHLSVLLECLAHDMPQLILSLVCILLGLFISGMQLYLRYCKKIQTMDIFYLGNFEIFLGIWRITDTRSAIYLFPDNPKLLGYIAIGALFLCCIPLMLFMRERFADVKAAPLLHMSIITSAVALLALVCQVLGAADFREMLGLSHVMLILCAVTVLVTALYNRKKSVRARRSWKYALLLAAGMVLDLVSFYVTGTSMDLVFTIIAFIIYTAVMFMVSILETSKQVYTDVSTGLFNKVQWEELINQKDPITEPIGIMMLDLNRLKHTNDTMGHEAGDRMIFNFSTILRNTLPPSSVICRWGGDEFAVLITRIGKEGMEKYLNLIHRGVEIHNEHGEPPPIHYAAGYALSSELPDLTRKELFAIADDRMYIDKKRWYAEHLDMVYSDPMR